jgi:hypothetical protein
VPESDVCTAANSSTTITSSAIASSQRRGIRATAEIRLRERQVVAHKRRTIWAQLQQAALSQGRAATESVCVIGFRKPIAFYAWHVGESTEQSLRDMHRCAAVGDDMARLSCYDSLGSLQPAKGANAPPLGTK